MRARLFLLVGVVALAMAMSLGSYFMLSARSREIEREYGSVNELKLAAFVLADKVNVLASSGMAPSFKKFKDARAAYDAAFDRVAALKVLPQASSSTKDAIDRILSLRDLSANNLDTVSSLYAQLTDEAIKRFGSADTATIMQFLSSPAASAGSQDATGASALKGRITLFISTVHGLNDGLDLTISSIGNQDLVVKDQIAEIRGRVTVLSAVIAIALIVGSRTPLRAATSANGSTAKRRGARMSLAGSR